MTDRRAPAPPAANRCAIAAHGICESRLSAIAALRDGVGPAGAPSLTPPPSLPPRFLRHADEHTVVGLHAVLAALASAPEAARDLARHGVVGAPCQAGRLLTARSLVQMQRDGAVAVSTHIVPQCSLHSVAGAVSVALGMHGPHLGVGGGADALAEGLVAAVALMGAQRGGGPSAVWLVATEWDEEPALDPAADPVNDPVCRGLALLLDARGPDDVVLDVRGPAARAHRPRHAPRRTARLAEFARAVSMCRTGLGPGPWSLECSWPGEIRLMPRVPSGRPDAAAPREAA